jgi:predicted GNAT superfamily acetyltransferase
VNQHSSALDRVQFRELRTADELAALCEFERRIWGEGDVVSLNMLVATVDEGGMAIGAYVPVDDASSSAEPDDWLVGAVYGFPSSDVGVLHSHYMAVDPALRRAGLGVQLKHRQRDWCLTHGYTTMRWTFDPLQLPNAHLNLRVLGAVGISYHVDHYGRMGGLNGSLPSDRLTVQWALAGVDAIWSERTEVAVGECTADDIADSTDVARRVRLELREQMSALMQEGWLAIDVDREQRRYVFGRSTGRVR